MLVCYLDDSGTDPQNQTITLAGYVAKDDQWQKFEAEVEPIFQAYQVPVLHAVALEKSSDPFGGWSVLKKQSFVAQICRVMSRYAMLGVSMSALKSVYRERADESGRKRTVTPFTFCANEILSWMMHDVRVGKAAHDDGLALIFEEGNLHNKEAELHLDTLRQRYPDLTKSLRSVSFIPKGHCRAIQMADLIAYYSRRQGEAAVRASEQERMSIVRSPGTMLKIIIESTPHRVFVAMDFGPNAPGSKFFAGDLPSESEQP